MNENNIIYFNTRDELTRINLADVMCFESDSCYVNIVLRNSLTQTLLASLNNIETITSTLPYPHFMRVGRKHIINLSYLTHINIQKAQLTLADSTSSRPVTLSASRESLRLLKQNIKEKPPDTIANFKASNCNMEAFFDTPDSNSWIMASAILFILQKLDKFVKELYLCISFLVSTSLV